MNKQIFYISTLFLISCAKVVAPTGGPKDTEGPKVISILPENKKTNFITKSFNKPYIEDEYNDNRYAITILYFHNVPEEIGKMEILIPTYIKRTKKIYIDI